MAQETSINQEQFDRIAGGAGFIAALDQSGGSTPKALKLYGVEEDTYTGDDVAMLPPRVPRSWIWTAPISRTHSNNTGSWSRTTSERSRLA